MLKTAPAVQGQFDQRGILLVFLRGKLQLRKPAGDDSGAGAACRAQPGQIARKPIREVHHGSSDSFSCEPPSESQSRLRVQMLLDGEVISIACSSAQP